MAKEGKSKKDKSKKGEKSKSKKGSDKIFIQGNGAIKKGEYGKIINISMDVDSLKQVLKKEKEHFSTWKDKEGKEHQSIRIALFENENSKNDYDKFYITVNTFKSDSSGKGKDKGRRR